MDGHQIQKIDSAFLKLTQLLTEKGVEGVEEIQCRMVGVLDRWETAKASAEAENCSHCNGVGYRYDNHITSAMHKCCVCKGTGKRSNKPLTGPEGFGAVSGCKEKS